jgi:hypothetical protein
MNPRHGRQLLRLQRLLELFSDTTFFSFGLVGYIGGAKDFGTPLRNIYGALLCISRHLFPFGVASSPVQSIFYCPLFEGFFLGLGSLWNCCALHAPSLFLRF